MMPLLYFRFFFSDDQLEIIVENTNKNAENAQSQPLCLAQDGGEDRSECKSLFKKGYCTGVDCDLKIEIKRKSILALHKKWEGCSI